MYVLEQEEKSRMMLFWYHAAKSKSEALKIIRKPGTTC